MFNSIEKIGWHRIRGAVWVKCFDKARQELMLGDKIFFSEESFRTYVVSMCVIEPVAVFEEVDRFRKVYDLATPAVLMRELYDICKQYNPYMVPDSTACKFRTGEPMCNFKTESIIVEGWRRVAVITADLAEMSCWFEVTPLPDNQWEITTKAENILGRFKTK